MKPPITILVVGATGMLGEPVARRLQAAGHCVRVLSRSAERARQRFGEGFEIVQGDVEDTASLDAALHGCQVVHINLQGGLDPDLERRGAENIAGLAHRHRIQRITYLSGASVCPENCWYAGTRAKYQAEKAIIASGAAFTIFRAHYFMESLHNFIHGGRALLIGRHPHPYPFVAADDYVRMVAGAMAMPEAADKTLYVCGPQTITMRQALETFCRIAHPEARLMYLPLPVAGLIARLGNRKELQAALPFFRYCQKAEVLLSGSPDEANRLLGAPETTLEDWSQKQKELIR